MTRAGGRTSASVDDVQKGVLLRMRQGTLTVDRCGD